MIAATIDAVDDFAGPGGWSLGARMVGLTELGYEWDDAACATAVAAGFQRVKVDVSTHDLERHQTRLYIASPPCTLFSSAGKGTGRDAIAILADAIVRIFAGEDCRDEVRGVIYRDITLPARVAENEARTEAKKWTPERVDKKAREDAFVASLVLEPARRIMQLDPEAIALEQVPEVLPLWQVYARCLRALGHSVWCGVLNAADYGVPQTRQRAILMASRVRTVAPPVPTHSQHGDDGDLFGSSRAKWVSMAAALGWGFDQEPSCTVPSGGAETGGAEPFANAGYRARLSTFVKRERSGDRSEEGFDAADGPCQTLTSKARSWIRMGNQVGAAVRGADEPAPTVLFGHRMNAVTWHEERPPTRSEREAASQDWAYERPATTVVGSFQARDHQRARLQAGREPTERRRRSARHGRRRRSAAELSGDVPVEWEQLANDRRGVTSCRWCGVDWATLDALVREAS